MKTKTFKDEIYENIKIKEYSLSEEELESLTALFYSNIKDNEAFLVDTFYEYSIKRTNTCK
jgi:hypothetical protein